MGFHSFWNDTPSNLGTFNKASDLGLLRVSQIDIKRTPVFLQILHFLSARNRNDVVALLQKPRDRQLRRATVLLLRQRCQLLDELDVLVTVLSLKTWEEAGAHVRASARGIRVGEGRCEQAASQRCVADDGDAKFSTSGEEIGSMWALDIARKGRVLDLDCSDGRNLDSTAKFRRLDIGQANVLDLARSKTLLLVDECAVFQYTMLVG